MRALCAALLTLAPARRGVGEPVPEGLVTSALVYNVAKMTTWPDEVLAPSEAPFLLCLLREPESYGNLFDAVEGKTVKGHVLRVRHEARLSELGGCQLLYVDEADEPQLHPVLSSLRHRPVLTIGGFDGFAHVGGMVGLFLKGGQMRVQVNRRALDDARLELSAQLLRMAEMVGGEAS